MKDNLPIQFKKRMEWLLGPDYERFMASYDAPRVYGLRVNRLKLDGDAWRRLSPAGQAVRPIPWAEDGYYYSEGDRPGKHPHYHAGLYYVQEPSAMAPVELLDVRPGHRVLDLCAAPGGKSTQIAGKLRGKGVLVTNDNAKERTKALAKNIELAGVRNAVVLNEEPAALVPAFREWFDRILVDAPCSGEGMFRKDDSMIADWEKHSVERCSAMQRDIIRHAADMLAPGGLLVYSTCTFSPEENEMQIASFLADRSDFEVVPAARLYGWTGGRPDWIDADALGGGIDADIRESIAGTVRLWPYLVEGEGHYAAVLRRKGEAPDRSLDGKRDRPFEAEADGGHPAAAPNGRSGRRAEAAAGKDRANSDRSGARGKQGEWLRAGDRDRSRDRSTDRDGMKRAPRTGRKETPEADPRLLWEAFAAEQLLLEAGQEAQCVAFGSRVYLQPEGLPPLDGLRVVRAGWFVGEAEKGRFTPSHALAMGLTRLEAPLRLDWPSDRPEVIRYLKGETLFAEDGDILRSDTGTRAEEKDARAVKGYVLVCTDGYPIGWGKYSGGVLKNELPAGWRLM